MQALWFEQPSIYLNRYKMYERYNVRCDIFIAIRQSWIYLYFNLKFYDGKVKS